MPKKGGNNVFWIIFVVVFLVSIFTIFGSVDIPIIGDAIQVVGYAQGDSELFAEIKGVEGFKDATIYFKETVKNGKIIYEENQQILFKGTSYNKVDVTSEDADKLKEILFTFKLSKEKLSELRLNASDVQLYVNGKEVSLSLEKEDDKHVFYTVTTSEMGEYVIGRKKVEPVIGKTVEEPVIEDPVIITEVEPIVEQPKVERNFFQKIIYFFKNLFKS